MPSKRSKSEEREKKGKWRASLSEDERKKLNEKRRMKRAEKGCLKMKEKN